MTNIKFSPIIESGITIYISKETDKLSLIQDSSDNKFYIRIKCPDGWKYPMWEYVPFDTITDAEDWLNCHNWDNATLDNIEVDDTESTILEAMKLLGLTQDTINCNKFSAKFKTAESDMIDVNVIWISNVANVSASKNGKSLPNYKLPRSTSNVARILCSTERLLNKLGVNAGHISLDGRSFNTSIQAAINTRNLAQNLVKVKSSNIWGYTINVNSKKDKFGDVIVQFKGDNGGPGDVYIYYDVPVLTYRRWHSAPSKGHYFWKYIRNYFKYSKLTGDKKGKLHNAVN